MSRALLEAFQWSELLLIFLVQAFADIESRALLALIVISLRLDSILATQCNIKEKACCLKATPATPNYLYSYEISTQNL